MDLMKSLWEKAKSDKKKIVLAEGEEERNIEGCSKILKNELAHMILIGNEEKINETAKKLNVSIDGAEIIDPQISEKVSTYTKEFYELRKHKGVTMEKAEQIVKDPIYFATMMVKMKDADGLVSGAIHTTGDLLRPGLQIVKTAKGASVVSSTFIMEVPNCEYGKNGMLLFADCAVNPNPTADELASIAISTAETAKALCDMEPKVAMLSFSSKGSAKHDLVDKVAEATKIAKEKDQTLI